MLPRRVAVAITLHHVFEPGERVVVAVSGGPDSLALLSVLREIVPAFPLHLTVAHFDHGWRAESRGDRDFVASMAESWGYDSRTVRAADDLPHTENAARAARYGFLRQIATATSSTVIALGHTQDDQVETLLLHLLRGSGSKGLGAMRRRDGDLARPLLDISRGDIEAYLAQLHLTPVRDASNDDPRFTRNRLRQQLMPAIDAFDPAARDLLARTADILSEEDRFIGAQLANLPDDATRSPGCRRRCSAESFAASCLTPALSKSSAVAEAMRQRRWQLRPPQSPRGLPSKPAAATPQPSRLAIRSVISTPTSSSCPSRWAAERRALGCGRWD